MIRRFLPVVLAGLAAVMTPAWPAAQDTSGAPAAPPTAFVNVSAVPMDTDRVLPDWTVVIRDGRVSATGPSSAITPPAGATVIDGRGKFLMPGLTEMHGHIPPPTSAPEFMESVLFLYVANGVTTVRGMQGAPGQLDLRDRAARNELVAPTLYLAGPAFSGNTARTVDEAVARVRQQKAEGWDLLKVQTGLSVEVYDAMARTAREVRLPFAGHVPSAVGVEHALEMYQDTIDHIDGYAEHLGGQTAPLEDRPVRELAERTARAGVGIVPTLVVWETLRGAVTLESRTSLPELKYLPREQVDQWTRQLTNRLGNPQFNAETAGHYIQNRMKILKALHEAGAEILLGSDAPQQFNVPGFSIHHEMRRMIDAGLTPYEVLRTGTANIGAHLIGKDSFGHIAIGHRADFILLDANPLADVANVQRRSGVMLRGRWIPEAEIQDRLAGIARANGF
jgi:imidazolonepropionase-like amidohydrolase